MNSPHSIPESAANACREVLAKSLTACRRSLATSGLPLEVSMVHGPVIDHGAPGRRQAIQLIVDPHKVGEQAMTQWRSGRLRNPTPDQMRGNQ